MDLGKTQIVVRERDMLDILDLSLHVGLAYIKPLSITMAMGVVPLMILNHLLIGWMGDVEFYDENVFRYFWSMMLLIFIEAPLASIFATTYLGQAVFLDRPRLRQVVIEVGRLMPRIAWTLLMVRGIGPAILFVLVIERGGQVNWTIESFLLPTLALYVILLRSLRPFISEIVLLERNPLRSQRASTMTIGKRSHLLHAPNGGELLLRWLGSAVVGVLLSMSVFGAGRFITGILFSDWSQGVIPGPLTLYILLPLSMWVIVGLMTVVRFLCYLDARIRQEGWEVELQLRAEAAKLLNKLT